MSEAAKVPFLWNPWRYEETQDGRQTKIAYSIADSGKQYKARSNTPGDWKPFDVALQQYQAGDFSGLGMLAQAPFVALDLDHCLDETTGGFTPEAENIMDRFPGGYCELSPSGTGLRIIVFAPGFEYSKTLWYEKTKALEVYSGGSTHWISITGCSFRDVRPFEDCTETLYTVMNERMKRPAKTETKPRNVEPVRLSLSDSELLDKARNAANGEKFCRLYDLGDISDYPSRSEADQALCNILAFWAQGDAARIEELFNASALNRDKWADRPDYRQSTIEKAVAGCAEFYDPSKGRTTAAKPSKNRPAVPIDGADHGETGPDLTKPLRPTDFTDVGQARIFADHFGDKACYCPEAAGRWMVFNGSIWSEDPGQARGFVHTLTDWQLQDAKSAILDATSKLLDVKKQDPANEAEKEKAEKELQIANAYFNFVKKYRYTARIEATLKESSKYLEKHLSCFDSDPFLLNTPAGVVDLKTGKIRPTRPEDYCTKVTACAPSHEGDHTWRKFLDDVTDNNTDMQAYLQEIAGMSLIGQVFEEKIIIAVGDGGNGKSTLFNLWLNVLKDYGKTVSPDVLLDTTRNTMPARATLRGARLVVLAETDRNSRIAGDKLKALCSKDDITAEAKYAPPITFKPSHSTVLCTNHPPALDLDGGVMARIAAVPFNHRFRDQAGEIKGFEYRLFEECGGAVLSWMISGAVRFAANAHILNTPQCVKDYTAKYFEDSDWIKAFINECFNIGDGLQTSVKDARCVYTSYCNVYGFKHRANRSEFNAAMERAGHGQKKRDNYRFFPGLFPNELWRMKEETTQDTPADLTTTGLPF